MPFSLKLLLLGLVDFCLIWLWVYHKNPDPSLSIGIILIIPILIALNLGLAILCLLMQKRQYGVLFLVNILLSSALMLWLFEAGIRRYSYQAKRRWHFEWADKAYELYLYKHSSHFSIYNKTDDKIPVAGDYSTEGGGLVLEKQPMNLYLKGDTLIGFPNSGDITIMMPYSHILTDWGLSFN